MASNFKFLETEFPVLANFGNLAEQYCYTDSELVLDETGNDWRNNRKLDVYIR